MPTYSGLFNNHYMDGTNSGTGVPATQKFNSISTPMNTMQRIARMMKVRGNRPFMELIRELTGSAVGANTASVTHRQIAAVDQFSMNGYGGQRTINSVSDINRVTASADETFIDNMQDRVFAPTTYPTDASGNGGGSKVGRF